MRKGHSWIGTSGWSYRHWRKGVFYPKDLPSRDELTYYAKNFDTVEINAPFYRLPKKDMVRRWREKTPDDFLFAVKLSRLITHFKRLHDCREALNSYFETMNLLKEKRGPLLVQLPPSMRMDLDRLTSFLEDFDSVKRSEGWRLAFEFRHRSWLTDEVFELLEKRKAAVVVHDMRGSANDRVNGVEFVYMRRHGLEGAYAGDYAQAQIERDAESVRHWQRQGKTVYAYYNNDAKGHALKNAVELIEAARNGRRKLA